MPTMTQDVEEAVEGLKGNTPEQIRAKIRSGELNQVIADPRLKDALLKGTLMQPSDVQPTDADLLKTDEPKKDDGTPPAKVDPNLGGHKSAEELLAAHNKLQELFNKTKGSLDSLNGERGQFGQGLKEKEAEVLQLKTKLLDFEKKLLEIPKEVVKPMELPNLKMPVPPDGDYESEVYRTELEAYNTNMMTALTGLAKQNSDVLTRNQELSEQVKASNDKVLDIGNKFDSTQRAIAQEESRKEAQGIYDAVRNLQKTRNELATSRDIKEIDDQIIGLGGAAAAAGIVPQKDIDKWAAIMSAVGVWRTKDSEGAIVKNPFVETLDQAYILNIVKAGKLDLYQNQKIVNGKRDTAKSLEEAQRLLGNNAALLPNGQLTGDEDNAMKSEDEKIKRLKELMAMGSGLAKNGKLFQEYRDLLVEFKMGESAPKLRPLT